MENLTNWLPFVATGLYTAIYLWIFKVQQSQIKSSEDINKKMERYMNQFDIDKIEKYNDVIKKTAVLEANIIVNNSEKVKNAVREQIGIELSKAAQTVSDKISDEFMELSIFAATVLMSSEHEEQESIKNRFLPLTKSYFDKDFLDAVRNSSEQTHTTS